MCAECLKKHTNIQISVYTFAHAYVFKPEARRVSLRAVHSSPYIRGAAQSEQCVLSCIAGTEFSVCWEKWATCVSVWRRIHVWIGRSAQMRMECTEEQSGICFACFLFVCVCTWKCWVAFSQCLLMCEMCPCWTVKPPAALVVKRPWRRSRATTWPVSPLLPYYSRFVEFYINNKFCFIPIKMSHNNLRCSGLFFFPGPQCGGDCAQQDGWTAYS